MKVLILLTICVISVYGQVSPDILPQCKRSDPQIEKCILDAVERMRPSLKTGIPDLNVPALEPFLVPTLKLDRTAPSLRLKAVIKNIKARGGSKFKVEKLRLHLNNKYAAEVKLTFPKLLVSADYDVKGSRLLTVDANGKGKMRGNFTGITVVAKGVAKAIKKEGVEYLQADKVVIKLRINHGQLSLDDAERPVAANSAAAFFNASPNIVLDILNPIIEETVSSVLKAFLNKIFAAIPLKDILLEE